jgi:hypothetical protein
VTKALTICTGKAFSLSPIGRLSLNICLTHFHPFSIVHLSIIQLRHAQRAQIKAVGQDPDQLAIGQPITSPRQAPIIAIYVDASADMLEAVVNGKRTHSNDAIPSRTGPENHWGLRYWALPKEGIDLTLRIGSFQPVQVQVVDQSYGLPDIPGTSFRSRPASMMPTPFGFGLSDVTLVRKSYTFDAGAEEGH